MRKTPLRDCLVFEGFAAAYIHWWQCFTHCCANVLWFEGEPMNINIRMLNVWVSGLGVKFPSLHIVSAKTFTFLRNVSNQFVPNRTIFWRTGLHNNMQDTEKIRWLKKTKKIKNNQTPRCVAERINKYTQTASVETVIIITKLPSGGYAR